MKKFYPVLIFFVLVSGFLVEAFAETPTSKGTVYFLVHSGACPCQREMCQAAEPVGEQIHVRLADGYEYKNIDYGVRPESVEPLMKQYKLFSFPVILVVDSDKKEVFKTQGKIKGADILKKLFSLGVITSAD